MSQNEPNGRGALFKNDKQGNEKRPDYTGSATIYGKEFNVSSWLQTSKNGIKYMGLSFNERQKDSGSNTGTQGEAPAADQSPADDDSIPF